MKKMTKDEAASLLMGTEIPYARLSLWGRQAVDKLMDDPQPISTTSVESARLQDENQRLASKNEQLRLELMDVWDQLDEAKMLLAEQGNSIS